MNRLPVLQVDCISSERVGTLRRRKRLFVGLCKRKKPKTGNWVVPRILFVPCVLHVGRFLRAWKH